MANPKGKKKTTKSTSTKAAQPRPRPIIKVPVIRLPANVTNENPPPAEVMNEDPLPAILHTPPQRASSLLQPSTNTSTTSEPMEVPNLAPAQRPAPPSSGSIRPPNAAYHKESTTTPTPAESEGTLAAKYATALAEIDRLKKAQSAAKAQELPELKRPGGQIGDLQKAMGLENDRPLYMSCRATVRDIMISADLPVGTSWHKQEPLVLAKITTLAKTRNPQLGRYEHGWATLEIMRTINKNKRTYNRKIGRSSSSKETLDDAGVDGVRDGNNEAELSETDQEVTDRAGKRTKVVQGGTSKRART